MFAYMDSATSLESS